MTTDYNIGQRLGAAGNQAAQVLQGSWRAIAEGNLKAEDIAAIHADLTADFFRNMSDIEASTALATHLGAVPATPAEAQIFQPVPQALPAAPAPQTAAPFTPADTAPVFVQQQEPQYSPQQYVPQQPQGPVPGVKPTTEQLWAEYFQNPNNFYDNRADKARGVTDRGQPINPNAADFKRKGSGEGLWLQGKYPAPAWVLQRFGLA